MFSVTIGFVTSMSARRASREVPATTNAAVANAKNDTRRRGGRRKVSMLGVLHTEPWLRPSRTPRAPVTVTGRVQVPLKA